METKTKVAITVFVIFLALLLGGIWVTQWWLSFKLFATAFVVLGAGAGTIDIMEKMR